jgi:hypothetical protein
MPDTPDALMRCAPDDPRSVDARIAMVQGRIDLDDAIETLGLDEVLRILGVENDAQ